MRDVESTHARAAIVRSWISTVFCGPAAATSMNPSLRALMMIPASPKTAFDTGTRLVASGANGFATPAAVGRWPTRLCECLTHGAAAATDRRGQHHSRKTTLPGHARPHDSIPFVHTRHRRSPAPLTGPGDRTRASSCEPALLAVVEIRSRGSATSGPHRNDTRPGALGSLLYRLYPLWRFYVIVTILLRHAVPYLPRAVRSTPTRVVAQSRSCRCQPKHAPTGLIEPVSTQSTRGLRMTPRSISRFLCLLALLILRRRHPAQTGTIAGRVTDSTTSAPTARVRWSARCPGRDARSRQPSVTTDRIAS